MERSVLGVILTAQLKDTDSLGRDTPAPGQAWLEALLTVRIPQFILTNLWDD